MAKAGEKNTSPKPDRSITGAPDSSWFRRPNSDSALRGGDWIPPGYIDAVAWARERGVDKVRDDLFNRRWQAFTWNKEGTGELRPIEPSFWGADEAGRWLKGESHPYKAIVLVRVEDEPTPPVTNRYLPPASAEPIAETKPAVARGAEPPQVFPPAIADTARLPPAERKMKPAAWFREALTEHPRQRDEGRSDYAHRLINLMATAPVTKQWEFTTVLRRLHDK